MITQRCDFCRKELSGEKGPQSVNWIDNGDRYSYISMNREDNTSEIRAYDPGKDEDDLIFNGDSLKFPNSDNKFNYRSFEWGQDSKHLLFQTNFKKIYRRSGNSDYYVYSLDDKMLTAGCKRCPYC